MRMKGGGVKMSVRMIFWWEVIFRKEDKRKTPHGTMKLSMLLDIICAVYFKHCLGAAHSKCRSKYAFSNVLHEKLKRRKKGKLDKEYVLGLVPICWSRVSFPEKNTSSVVNHLRSHGTKGTLHSPTISPICLFAWTLYPHSKIINQFHKSWNRL